MKKILGLTLGIVTAIGGFVDIGEIVFAGQAGGRFGYELIWPIILGAISITVFTEMAGRVAIVTHKPVVVLLRERLGYSVGLCTLVLSTAVNILTCAAEVGGVAIVLRLLLDLPYGLGITLAVLVLVTIVSLLTFSRIEKAFGLMGLFMLVFVVAAVSLGIDWGAAAGGLIPHLPSGGTDTLLTYGYFAVGLLAATAMPYEIQFYSSGEIEEESTKDDLPMNAITAAVGYGFGSVVTIAIIILGAQVFLPAGISPGSIGTAITGPMIAFGVAGVIAALLGSFFAIGGAAIETSLAGAYGIAQFFGFAWGKRWSPWRVPRFSLSWLAIFGLALLVLVSGVDPIELTEYAVIFSVVILPLGYLPVLLVARDKKAMGEHANPRWLDVLAVAVLILLVVVAVLAVPLMYLSRMGQA